jgi:hypothetical protein
MLGVVLRYWISVFKGVVICRARGERRPPLCDRNNLPTVNHYRHLFIFLLLRSWCRLLPAMREVHPVGGYLRVPANAAEDRRH